MIIWNKQVFDLIENLNKEITEFNVNNNFLNDELN